MPTVSIADMYVAMDGLGGVHTGLALHYSLGCYEDGDSGGDGGRDAGIDDSCSLPGPKGFRLA